MTQVPVSHKHSSVFAWYASLGAWWYMAVLSGMCCSDTPVATLLSNVLNQEGDQRN